MKREEKANQMSKRRPSMSSGVEQMKKEKRLRSCGIVKKPPPIACLIKSESDSQKLAGLDVDSYDTPTSEHSEENTPSERSEPSSLLAHPVPCVSPKFRDESSSEEPVAAHPVAAHDAAEVLSPSHDVAPIASSSAFEETSHQRNIVCSDSVAFSSDAVASLPRPTLPYLTPLVRTVSQVHGALLQDQRTSTRVLHRSGISFGPFGKGVAGLRAPQQPLAPRQPCVPRPRPPDLPPPASLLSLPTSSESSFDKVVPSQKSYPVRADGPQPPDVPPPASHDTHDAKRPKWKHHDHDNKSWRHDSEWQRQDRRSADWKEQRSPPDVPRHAPAPAVPRHARTPIGKAPKASVGLAFKK